ncbi:MAG TPA: hypothetical protein VGP43_00970 [Chitinophagaceae bacterium]|nr:hypothetical protein [Chitinophagaceae bacterium]
MNSRSKKYYESRKAQKGDKKGSATNAGYDEQNEKTIKEPKKNPATSKKQEQPKEDSLAAQDDTGGGNDSGKRSDDN